MHNYLMRQGVGEPTRVYTLYAYRHQDDVNEFHDKVVENVIAGSNYGAAQGEWFKGAVDNHGYLMYADMMELGTSVIVFLGASRYSGSDRDVLVADGAELLRRTVAPVWRETEPAWLRYGSAALHETLALSQAGLVSYESARNLSRRYPNGDSGDRHPLSGRETERDFHSQGSAYGYAFLATELLASIAGTDTLLRFFENVQLGKSWKTIFQGVFGMTVGEFYDVFDIFGNAGFPPVSVKLPVSSTPSEPRYSITRSAEEYGYEIELPHDWVEMDGYIDVAPGGSMFITEVDLPAGTPLESYAETVTDNLEHDWWSTPSRLEINEFVKKRKDGNEFYIVKYVVKLNEIGCAFDIWELIAVGSSLPQSSAGYRVKHEFCEEEAREWERSGLDKTRQGTLESFRIITQPAPYYKQFIEVEGIIVKANEKVEVASMYNSADVIKVMMSNLKNGIKQCLVGQGAAMAIAPIDEVITTLPEFQRAKGALDWAGGIGATKGDPVSGSIEEEIIRGGYGIVLHEFAHAVQNLCFTEDEQRRWGELYENAKESGAFSDAYGMTNDSEFFAEFSISFFEQSHQYQSRWAQDEYGLTRQQLSEAYPDIFDFLAEIYVGFEPEPYVASVPAPTPTATPIAVEATVPEREALVALYVATGGSTWRNNKNWLTEEPTSRWHGVEIFDGHVTALHLDTNGLQGEIPPELGNLTRLTELWLGDGNLIGELPPELASLTNLNVLYLSFNDFSGSIPEWIGELTSLRSLYLDGNQFEGELPEELGNLVQLKLLTLHDNQGLTGELPETLTNIRDLDWFPFHRTGLCAPLTDSFQAWLKAIPDWQGSNCPP